MSTNMIDFIIKAMILFFLAATSQMAFKNRQWAAMLVTLGLWLTVFRTAILRATTLYVGFFGAAHSTPELVRFIQGSLMSGWIVIVTDLIALIATLFAFVMYSGDNKKVKNST